jgi:hypothetical protein
MLDDVRGAQLFSAIGGMVAYVARDGAIMVQGSDGTAGRKIGTVALGNAKAELLFDGAQRVMLVPQEENTAVPVVQGVDGSSASLPKPVPGQTVLALSPMSMLVTNSKAGTVSLVSSLVSNTKGVDLPLADANSAVIAGALSADELYAAVLQDNGTVSVWNTQRPALVALFGEPDQKLSNIAFPPDLRAIDALGQDGTVYRWPIYGETIDLIDVVNKAIPKTLTDVEKRQIRDSASASARAASAQ